VKRIKHTWGARDASSHLEAPFVFFFGVVGEGVVGMMAARRRRTHSLHVVLFRLLDMVEVYEMIMKKKTYLGLETQRVSSPCCAASTVSVSVVTQRVVGWDASRWLGISE
jgi:hypothetical protein